MSAPLFSTVVKSSSVQPFVSYGETPRSSDRNFSRLASRRSFHRSRFRSLPDRAPSGRLAQTTRLNSLLSSVFELLAQGVIVVSADLKPRYWNSKAQTVCSEQLGISLSDLGLPFPMTEACYRLMRETNEEVTSIMVEYRAPDGSLIRLRVCWLDAALVAASNDGSDVDASRRFMVVFLENCEQVMQREVWLQKEKYDLTDREAEIWMLIRKEYTYQEIAHMLQISLNTVKTHVKNVYAKRRTGQGEEKFWFYE